MVPISDHSRTTGFLLEIMAIIMYDKRDEMANITQIWILRRSSVGTSDTLFQIFADLLT